MGISAEIAIKIISAIIVGSLIVLLNAINQQSATTALVTTKRALTSVQLTLTRNYNFKTTFTMSTIKILQLNTECLRTSKSALLHYENIFQPDIICLQETWTKEKVISFKDWSCRNRTIYNNKQSGYGVATFVHPKLKNVFREDLYNDDIEAIWNEFEFNNETITLGNFYIPPKDYDQLVHVDNQLLKVSNPNAIILGDFNSQCCSQALSTSRSAARGTQSLD